MKVMMLAVGAPKARSLAAAIREYESRISHYFNFEAVEIRAGRIPPRSEAAAISEREGRTLLARVPAGLEIVALDRQGQAWSSEQLAEYLGELAIQGRPGAAFLIGGALGLGGNVLSRADKVLSLSAFTLPHELARLVLAEQIYRSGTIQRGEPYHKRG